MNDSMHKTEKRGRSLFIWGTIFIVILGLPLSIIGIFLSLLFKISIVLNLGLIILGVGIVFFFAGLLTGTSVAGKDVEQSIDRLRAIEDSKNKPA